MKANQYDISGLLKAEYERTGNKQVKRALDVWSNPERYMKLKTSHDIVSRGLKALRKEM